MSNATSWTTVRTETEWTPLEKLRWKTIDRYWVAEPDGGETFVCEQRHRVLRWKHRRKSVTFDDRMVIGRDAADEQTDA